MKHVRFTKILQKQRYLLHFFAALFVLTLTSIESLNGQTTNTWDGSSSNYWNTAANWSLNSVPTSAHDVVININADIQINTNSTINTLNINGNSEVKFTSSGGARRIRIDNTGSSIASGSTLTLQGSTGYGTRSMTIAYTGGNNTMYIAGTLILSDVGEGTIYNATNSLTKVSGLLKNDDSLGTGTAGTITSTASNLSFLLGGSYLHARNGGVIPTATWATASACIITGVTSTVPTVAGFNQAFGNFTWNCTAQSANISLAANLKKIDGNFTLSSTNANQLILSAGTTTTLSVLGNFSMNNGTLNFNSGANISAMNVAGNFSMSGGTITETSSGTANINFNGTSTQTYTKTAGSFANIINFEVSTNSTVDFGTSILDGSIGTFNLVGNGKVITKNTGGFALSGTTGTIQVSGTRTYSSTASYEFNGTSAQVTGLGLVTANNVTINNAAGVSLSTNTTINNLLTLLSGKLTIGSNNLTLGTGAVAGAPFANTNMIVASGTGQVRILITSTPITYAFPIGDNTSGDDYSPIEITLTSATLAPGALIAVRVTDAKHPNNNSATNFISRYWTVDQTGITNINSSITATFATSGDVDGDPLNMITSRFVTPNWSEYNVSTATQLSASSLVAFGDFTARNNIPVINVSTTTLSGFNYVEGFGPSTEQSFNISGSALNTNITILPSTDFEISLGTGVNFVPSTLLTVDVINREVSSTPIYVRMKAGLLNGTVAAQNVVSSSTGVSDVNVSCSGTVTHAPAITVVSALSTFAYNAGGGPSPQQQINVSGAFLSSDITITPPTNYEISTTSGSNFVSTPITLTQSGGNVAETPIYIRLKAGLYVNTYNENLTLTATSATTQNVALQGVVNNAKIMVSSINLGGFIYTFNAGPSGSQILTVSGSNLSSNITITAPTNFQVSISENSGYASSLSLTHSGGTVSATPVYVRMVSSLNIGSYSGNLTAAATGAIQYNISCSGMVVASTTNISSNNNLNGFAYTVGNGPSVVQSFTVSGTSLTEGITVTPPVNFEISLTNNSANFGSTALIIPQTAGSVNAVPIYVRLKSGLAIGSYNGENIILTSQNASSYNISCNGIVVNEPTLTAGLNPGNSVCPGSIVNLTATGSVDNWSWTGPNAYTSNLQNPSVPLSGSLTTSDSGTYIVTGSVLSNINILTNGGFESGNTGFVTVHTYKPNTTNLWTGEYAITTAQKPTAKSFQDQYSSCSAHTDIASMVVNGLATIAGYETVWSQSVNVAPNTMYEFSYYITRVHDSPVLIQLYANGDPIGQVNNVTTPTCTWTKFTTNVNSGSSDIIQLLLINRNIDNVGNNYALDDIVFQPIFTRSSSTILTVNATLTPSVSIVASDNDVYQGTIVTFTATPVNGGNSPSYQWKVNGINVGTNSSTYSYAPVDNDNVSCVITSNYPCLTTPNATSNVINMNVLPRTNYWRGNISNVWGNSSNWTGGFVPAAGDDVEFAKKSNNNGVAAERDLQLDINRTIGYLINDSASLKLIIPANLTLIVNNSIQSGTNPDKVLVMASTTLANGSIIFRNTQSLPVYGTVQMYSIASWNKLNPINQKYNWQFFGIPLESSPTLPTFYGAYVRELIESDNDTTTHWRSLTNESVLQPFIGYELCQESPKFYTFKGKLVNSNYNSGQFVKTVGALYPGQHLFANPYTAAMDIRQIEFGSGVEATAYLYATGTFLDWRNLRDLGEQGLGAAPGQYFAVPKNQAGQFGIPLQVPSMGTLMVRIPAAQASTSLSYVSFNYSAVTMGNSERQRTKSSATTQSQTTTTIEIEGDNGADKVWIMSHENYTRGFDNGFDGKKLIGNALNPQFYAVENDGKYQINSVDDINNTTFSFQAGQDKEYKMTIKHDESTQAKYNKIYLHDLVENKIIDISENGTIYNFTATSTTKPVIRFKILSQSATEEHSKTSNTKVYNFDNKLFVQNFSAFDGKVYVYDISGRTVGIKSISANENIQIAAPKNNTYIVKTVVGNTTETNKIFIR